MPLANVQFTWGFVYNQVVTYPGVRTGILADIADIAGSQKYVCVASFICDILEGMPCLQVRAIYDPALRYLRLQKHWQDTQNQPSLYLRPPDSHQNLFLGLLLLLCS